MAAFNYCGVSVFAHCNLDKTFIYFRVGSNADYSLRYVFVYDRDLISRFPNLSQEDLFKCICSVKRKYNIL